MADVTVLDLIRGIYDYHWWANRRLFDAARALGEAAAGREVGKQFSFPTLRGMFTHIHAADWIWLERFQGRRPDRLPDERDVPGLEALRGRWDAFEVEQRAFVGGLAAADLARPVVFQSTAYPSKDGGPYRLPLGPLLQHVANHATHHRSEIATMLTMVSGSAPPTDLSLYLGIASGQGRQS
ncbi:MAG: DinB family protein [Candidatus Rokubacteria bacterium]|nr:DinB family protein [Candidatus Rokubacteria bacterium]